MSKIILMLGQQLLMFGINKREVDDECLPGKKVGNAEKFL
jgi:hypothetical protein